MYFNFIFNILNNPSIRRYDICIYDFMIGISLVILGVTQVFVMVEIWFSCLQI